MYKPTASRTLAEAKEQQIRLGIQGYGGTGKTTSAVGFDVAQGFPNPVVINIDRGLGAFSGRDDIIEIPLWDFDYCKKINGNHQKDTDLLTTIRIFLEGEAKKLGPDQTLVFDGNTGLQNAYHKWYSVNKVYSASSGKEDSYGEWKLKLQAYNGLMELFKTLKCHVVFIAHETDKKDSNGEYTGKIRPLLSGSFNDQIISHFTDWVRALTMDKPSDISKMKPEELKKWDMNQQEFADMCNSFPRNTIYYWQLESDNYFDGKISSLVKFPRYIPALYSHFKMYMRGGNGETKETPSSV